MYCNFSTVITALYEQIDNSYDILFRDNPASQTAFITALLSTYNDFMDMQFDAAAVNRFFHNTRPLPKKIQSFYSKRFNSLFDDVKEYIVPWLTDVPQTVKLLHDIVSDDTYMKNEKKLELLSYCDKTDFFIAKVIHYSMYQPIKPKENKHTFMTFDQLYFDNLKKYRKPPQPCDFFCGRDKELTEFHDAVTVYKHVFIHGIAGIGKSEFAKAYAEKYSENYENIIFMTFRDDLETTIALLEVTGKDKSVAFAEHYRKLESLDDNSLIIIDNFNTTMIKEPFLKKILKLNCRIVFTTRCSFNQAYVYELNEISDSKILLKLVEKIFPDTLKYADTVAEIIEILHHHTFAVSLAAQLLKTGLLKPDAVLEKLKQNAVNPFFTDNITTEKDNIYQKRDYYSHIHLLFSLFELSENMHYVLRCCGFLNVDGADVRQYAELLGLQNLNDIHDLDEIGLLRLSEENVLSMHPIIRDIIFTDLSPSIQNCRVFLTNAFDIFKLHGIAVPDYQLSDILISVCRNIDRSDVADFLFYVEEIYSYFEECNMYSQMKIITDIYCDAVNNLTEKEDKYLAKMYWIQSGYIGKVRSKYAEAISVAKKALALADSIGLEFEANMHHNLGWMYYYNKQFTESKAVLEKSLEIYYRINEKTHDTLTTINLLNKVNAVLSRRKK